MPLPHSDQISPPSNWQDFEALCCDLWSRIWNDPNSQLHGRPGQAQHGVDISGRPNRGGSPAGVQCKNKDNLLRHSLSDTELLAEVAKAVTFQPPLGEFIVATTGPKDVKIEELARQLTDQHHTKSLFSVHVFAWRDILLRLASYSEVLEKHYPYIDKAWFLRRFQKKTFLPYEPEDFVGRTNYLEELGPALAEKATTFLLFGEPGCGKSTLALKIAHQHQDAFDAVVFQHCGERSAQEIGAELAERLGLGVKELPPEEQIAQAKNWLSERRTLLVLDDIWNHDVRALVPGPPVSVLFTSRQRSLHWVSARHSRCLRRSLLITQQFFDRATRRTSAVRSRQIPWAGR